MSNDPTNKVNLDPIPVTAAPPRPELPKVPEMPSLASLLPKPVASTPAPAPAPASAMTPPAAEVPITPAPLPPLKPTSMIPEVVWQYLHPTRTKGVVAAGVLSLLGGAAVMKYVWPARPAATAQNDHDRGAPLPETTHGRSGGTLATEPKVEAVALAPATVPPVPNVEVRLPSFSPPPPPTTTVAMPKVIDLPIPTVTVPITTPAPTVETLPIPNIALVRADTPMSPPPVPAPAAVPLPGSIALPPIGTSPPPIPAPSAPALDVKLPAVTSPLPVPPPLALPAVTTPVVGVSPPPVSPLPTPPALELPKVDALPLPGALPPISPLPVVGATSPPPIATPAPPKLDVTVPALTNVALPPVKVDMPTPRLDVPPALPNIGAPPAFEVKPAPAPALELPTVGATPAAPAAVATNTKTDYDVDLHYVKVGDSWAAVSKQYYGDERYADALKGYNSNATLTQLQRAEVPPIHVLRKNFATVIGKPAEKETQWGAITPTGGIERKTTGGGYKTYTVPAGGKMMKEIAAAAYGDENYWGAVWEANPKLAADKTIPEGTKVVLTSQSKIGE